MGKQDRIYQEKETQEATAAGGGASTGAFSGPFMQPIRREMPEGLNLPKKPIPKYATIMYRDGGNYKSFFLVELPIELYQRIKFTDNGEVIPTEFEIEDFGIDPETLWNSTGSDYDEELDHNLVDVIDVHNDLPDNGLIELSEGLNLPKKQFKQYYVYDSVVGENFVTDEDGVIARAVELRRQFGDLDDPSEESLNDIDEAIDYLYSYNYKVDKYTGQDLIHDINEGLNLPKKKKYQNITQDNIITGDKVICIRDFGHFKRGNKYQVKSITPRSIHLLIKSRYNGNLVSEPVANNDLITHFGLPLDEGLNLPKRRPAPYTKIEADEMGVIRLGSVQNALDALMDGHEVMVKGYGEDWDNYTAIYMGDFEDMDPDEILNDLADYDDFQLWSAPLEPLNWHVIYDELRKLNLSVEELEEICNHYGISTIQSNGNGPTDYHWTLEELVDYFQQNTNDYREFMAMRQQPLESEMDEGTDIGLVGAGGHGSGFAYIDPYGKGHKTRGTWAKNEASMYHNRKPYWPGGSFVTVKKKCQKFPYCNQGDTGALNFSNPKAARSQSLREGLNLPKKLKSDYTISVNVEEFNQHRGEYGFIYEETIPAPFGNLEDVKHLCDQMLKRVANDVNALNVEYDDLDEIRYAIVMQVANNDVEQDYYESSLPYGFIDRFVAVTHANSILAVIARMNTRNKQTIYDNYNKFDDIYLKHKIMGTAQRLKEYETKLFNGLFKENILGPQRQQPIGDETDLIRDLDAMGGETQLDEVGTDIPVTDMDVSSIALELKDKLPSNPTEMDLFDGLCDIGYCGKYVGEIFNEVMQELVNMGINITMAEGKKKGKWMQKVKDDIEERGTEGKCTPITKPGCTGKAKALTKTFKNVAKKKDQNMKTEKTKKHESISHQVFKRIMNENEYRMVGDNIQHLNINYNSDGSVATARVEYLPNAVNNKTARQEWIPIPIGDAGNALLKQYQPYLGNKTSVNETATPGITMYDKIHGESGTANKAGIKRSMDNAKRLNTVADQTENEKLSGIGKGEPKYGNFDKDKKEYDDDYIAILRGMGLQDLQFDSEPAKDFKERAEEAIVGSARMGNNPDWANAQRDFDGTKGELGEKIIATAKKKREKIDIGKKDNEKWSISTRYPDISHSQTHIATEGKSFQNLKTKKVIYFQKDLDNLIPESHKVEGAKFKLFDGKKTVYDLKWEGGTIVIENETNKTLVESERNLFKKMSGYSVGQYKVKPKGYLTSKP